MEPTKNSVYLVEDDPFITELLAKSMAKNSWDLHSNNTGKDAFEEIKKTQPQTVILDIMLPEMDGIEILKLLKADPATKAIPVIMFSNLSEESKIRTARELGVVRFFIKANSLISEIVEEVGKQLKLPVQAPEHQN